MGVSETILADLGPVVQENNIVLFIILILLFVIGYKLLQTVIRLGLIAIMSGVFLVVLDMVGIGPAVTVQRFILFMVLGTGLFIFYSTLATTISFLDRIYSISSRTVRWAFRSKRKRRKRRWPGKIRQWVHRKRKERAIDTDTEKSKEKTIVLDEVEDEADDDE